MTSDYHEKYVNYRDVGKSLRLIGYTQVLPEGRLLRGGKIDFVTSAAALGSPRTIINLRKNPDHDSFGANLLHYPLTTRHGKYDTQTPLVRFWLNNVINIFADANTKYPVLIHCSLGKDRTGVVVAALLKILNVPDEFIIQEYLLSHGTVEEGPITLALAGIGDAACYFDSVDIIAVTANLTLRQPPEI